MFLRSILSIITSLVFVFCVNMGIINTLEAFSQNSDNSHISQMTHDDGQNKHNHNAKNHCITAHKNVNLHQVLLPLPSGKNIISSFISFLPKENNYLNSKTPSKKILYDSRGIEKNKWKQRHLNIVLRV